MEEEVKTVVETPVDTIEYRGYSVPVYMDDYGQQFYTVLDGEKIGFGAFNSNYEEDVEYLIDKKLDHVCYFEKYPGSKLEYFFNGYGNRDLRLVSRSRTIKIYLNKSNNNLPDDKIDEIKKECLECLEKYNLAVKPD